MKQTKRYWISWIFKGADHRPIEYPPPTPIAAWWCSGSDANGDSVLCAIVHAESETRAQGAIKSAWLDANSEITTWRFCEERAADWLPNDRFPISSDWAKERLGL